MICIYFDYLQIKEIRPKQYHTTVHVFRNQLAKLTAALY